MRATYWNPLTDQPVECEVNTVDDVLALCKIVAGWPTESGLTTIQLEHANGANLSMSFDGGRAFLVWMDPLGESHSSVGGTFTDNLVFDYMGSYSEAPSEALVPFRDAIAVVGAFMETGQPATNAVLFSPD